MEHHDVTVKEVCSDIQANINQARERLVDIDMCIGDEWPMEFVNALRMANVALDRMEAMCDKVRKE
jgi:hypothetical protein